MRKFSIVIMAGLFLIMIVACSNTTPKSVESTYHSSGMEEEVELDEKDLEATEVEPKPNRMTNNETASEESDTGNSVEILSKEPSEGEKEFDVEQYLNENYVIENTYYTTILWENEETGRTEYIVSILPATQEFGQEIDELFKSESVYFDDERTKNLFDVAEQLLTDLPQINQNVHIESVLWKSSEEEEFPILLIQDRDQSTIN